MGCIISGWLIVPEIRIELSGARIVPKMVPMDVMVKSLGGLSSLLNHIIAATESIPKDKQGRKKFYQVRQFYVAGIEKGSSVVVLRTSPQMTLTETHPVIGVLKNLFSNLEDVQIADEEEAYKKTKKMFPKVTDRIHILNAYQEMWKASDVEITIGSPDIEIEKKVRLSRAYRPRINSWLSRELRRSPSTFQGVITRIKADGARRYFTIFDENNNLIECDLTSDREQLIIGLFKVPIELRGTVVQVGTKQKIVELFEVEELASIKILPKDYPALTTILEVPVQYNSENGNWIAEDETVGLRAVADSLNEVKEEIIVLLDFMVDRYLIQQHGEQLTPKLAQSIEELKKIINPNNRKDKEHWINE